MTEIINNCIPNAGSASSSAGSARGLPGDAAEEEVGSGYLELEELRFENRYSRLAGEFLSRHRPEPLENQFLIHFNSRAARLLDLDPEQAERRDLAELFTVQKPWPGVDPLAMCYAGHQFGQYVPRLGDGRALLLGQVRNRAGEIWDLHLKGSGLTLYSRQGDGKAVLRSTIREYLASVAMAGLGIPTTHALAMFGSDEEVYRESIETGAMIVRMAPSHLRFGTFEYFFYRQQFDALRMLADYAMDQHFPGLRKVGNPYLSLLETVVRTTAALIAHWQSVGFCHGVMNTDNMSIHGITIDYGPYGFMDTYRSDHVCNHSDHAGRYAFDRQPPIALFNLSCLAQSLLPVIDDDPERAAGMAMEVLQAYEGIFEQEYLSLKRSKLGLKRKEKGDGALYDDLLTLMQSVGMDFTITFRLLGENPSRIDVRSAFLDMAGAERERARRWLEALQFRIQSEDADPDGRSDGMKKTNPRIVLRNHIAEQAIRCARDDRDFSEIGRLTEVFSNPYEDSQESDRYAGPPPQWAAGLSVSCSS